MNLIIKKQTGEEILNLKVNEEGIIQDETSETEELIESTLNMEVVSYTFEYKEGTTVAQIADFEVSIPLITKALTIVK